jgi:hypothetical protein
MCWTRNALEHRGYGLFWTLDKANMRNSAFEGQGWMVWINDLFLQLGRLTCREQGITQIPNSSRSRLSISPCEGPKRISIQLLISQSSLVATPTLSKKSRYRELYLNYMRVELFVARLLSYCVAHLLLSPAVHSPRVDLHRKLAYSMFLVRDQPYVQIKEISHDSKVARVIRADVNWITSPRCVVKDPIS